MEKSTLNRIKIEMHSFKGLVITNLLGAAFALAFSMAYSVPKLIPLLTEGTLEMRQVPYLGLILVGFVVAINWIILGAELMDEHDDIVQNLENVGHEDDEIITGIIVQSIAFYRENQVKIQRLGFGSRIVGSFLLINAVIQAGALFSGSYPFRGIMVLGQWFAMISCFVIGLLGFYVPTVVRRFTETWDARLISTVDVEEKLGRILGNEG